MPCFNGMEKIAGPGGSYAFRMKRSFYFPFPHFLIEPKMNAKVKEYRERDLVLFFWIEALWWAPVDCWLNDGISPCVEPPHTPHTPHLVL